MKLYDAIKLISGIDNRRTQQWADLGCGEGLFTTALGNLLETGSTIHAVDTNQRALSVIPDKVNDVVIKKHKLDFVQEELPFTDLDGVLMANAFHFVKDKSLFISKLKEHLKPTHSLLMVEYDTDASNRWVPYPMSFKSMQDFFLKSGYGSIGKVNELPSLYNRANIYSAIIYL